MFNVLAKFTNCNVGDDDDHGFDVPLLVLCLWFQNELIHVMKSRFQPQNIGM